jgi:NAD(P)-dependent dehydrogenase (short-subunit alcohol dehydrogenase family)
MTILALRIFDMADQRRFAELSGDRNPMHVDALAARKTQAGELVVHGVHLLLWALDAFAASDPELGLPRRVKTKFNKFIGLGQPVSVVLVDRKESSARIAVQVGDAAMTDIAIDFGGAPARPVDFSVDNLPVTPLPTSPLELGLEDLVDSAGQLKFATSPPVIAARFPAAARWLGDARIASLAASTNLVGMVCPGLHSIFGGLTVDFRPGAGPDDGLAYKAPKIDTRFRRVQQSISGGGLSGSVESFVRIPPTEQAGMASLIGVIEPGEFAGGDVLIVGGSRGIGAFTAKLLAAGGAQVTITYRVGKSEAESVAEDIRSHGGACRVEAYDSLGSATEFVKRLAAPPTHVYYMATPHITKPATRAYDRARLDEFLGSYIDGFYNLVVELCDRQPALSAFYPSSVAVDKRPIGWTEYSMSKAAGEIMCEEMNSQLAPLHVTVSRLPRLATDQTATVMPTETASMLDTMLPIVREVQSWPRR